MRIIIAGVFDKNMLAAFNRMKCYVKGLSEAGADVTLMAFVKPDTQNICVPTHNVEYHIVPQCSNKLLTVVNRSRFIIATLRKKLQRGDVLMFYTIPPEIVTPFTLRRDIILCAEQTENNNALRSTQSSARAILHKFEDLIVKRLDALFVISDSLKKLYEDKGVDPARIHRINMIVDPARFTSASIHKPGYKYIAYCGSVSLHKDGADTLIKAFAKFHAQNPEYKLLIIGGFISENDKHELRTLVETLGLSESVVFTGCIAPDEMPALLKGADILALARPDNMQAHYGFPTKLGEYLSAGRPVVLTRVGEIQNFLTDKVNCQIARPDDVDDFAEKLQWVASHPSEAEEMAHRAHKLIENDFSYITQTRKFLDIVTNIHQQKNL